jgi:hypothetical protein
MRLDSLIRERIHHTVSQHAQRLARNLLAHAVHHPRGALFTGNVLATIGLVDNFASCCERFYCRLKFGRSRRPAAVLVWRFKLIFVFILDLGRFFVKAESLAEVLGGPIAGVFTAEISKYS